MTSVSDKHYRLGVALSGGGARGFAHVGALKALEEFDMKPDVIAGVSAGSVVAVLYAAGVPFDKMLKLFASMKFRDFCEFKFTGGGFFRIDRFKEFVMQLVGDKYVNLEDLPIPTVIGVTDLDHGRSVLLDHGPIGEAVMASCSIPILFQPVDIDGVRYVDGGVTRNLPSWAIRERCDYLVGVNCSPLTDTSYKNNVFEVGMRAYDVMSKVHQAKDIELCDLAIETPEIAGYKVFNLKEINQVYIRGYASAKKIIKEWPHVSEFHITGHKKKRSDI